MQPTVRICFSVTDSAVERVGPLWGQDTRPLPTHLYELGNTLARMRRNGSCNIDDEKIGSLVLAVKDSPTLSTLLQRFYDMQRGFICESSVEIIRDIRTRELLIAMEAKITFVPQKPVTEPVKEDVVAPARRLNFRGLKSISTGGR